MTRALCGILLALAFTLCGTTATVHAPLPDALAPQTAQAADTPTAHNNVRIKVQAKIYRSPWSPAPVSALDPASGPYVA